ncbi:MAG: hypothetical protein IJN39_01745, partial [Clostridia bacterium]|nr:hypothetical protein [Clostridia bacterium]
MENRVLKLLQGWDKYSEADYFLCPDTKLLTYGTGYGGWAVQTNQKALAAIAVLGVKTNNHDAIEKALGMLRFSLRTHIEGDMVCLDGKKWGHTWISILGIERMMHAIYLLIPYMTEDDKALMEKVFVSECEWICDNHPILANPDASSKHNAPESNMWNGAFLYRVAKMYPHIPRAKDFIEKGEAFMLNALSIESDVGKDGVVGANYFDSFALNHHRYLNVGYMVITMSQIAMLHFYCKEFNIEPPKNLYNNVEGSWKLIKSCTAPDGRLIRIGGDTRVRYCYCQDYAVPMWLFIKDYLKDKDCDKFLDGWLGLVEKEVEFNGDGSFLSDRCGNLKIPSPVYYTRLESDRAAALSMIPAWKTDDADKSIETIKAWHDDFHGASMIQNEKNLISWVWGSTHGGPVGLCVPKSDSSFAEWEWNLAGCVKGIGAVHEYIVKEHKEQMLENGF